MAQSPHLTPEEVRQVAHLARLELGPEELERMTSEIGRILAYVQLLSEANTTDVPPTAQVHLDRLPLRADEPLPSLPRETVLGESPRIADGGFAVPSFVDEG